MSGSRLVDVLLTPGTHASRPATPPKGSIYPCTTHSKLEQYDSTGTWVDWFADTTGGGSSSVPINRALGKTYTLSGTPNASYPDATNDRAFDGAAWGGKKLNDGNWLGGYTSGENVGYDSGTTVQCVYDLTSAQNVGLVICRGRYGTGGVYRPVSFQVEHSDDNSTWTSDLNVSGLSNGGQPGDDGWLGQLPITASSHRYWRITIGRDNVSGHFLFMNEIELWG